jgi:hypothetical protein
VALGVGVEVSGRDLRVTGSRLAIAVASVVVLALVGACSGEREPGMRPSEPSSPPVGRESAADPLPKPAMPPAADGKGASAARAFVHYWLKTLNYAIESGDSAAVGAISSPTCQECGRIVKTIDDIYGRDGRLSGGTWRMTSLRALPVDRGADWAGYVTAAVSEQKWTEPGGGKGLTYDAGQGFMYTYAARQRDSWEMVWMHISV